MNIKPCVIGLGYVGLPALIKISKKFDTYGYDVNKERINSLKKRIDVNKEFSKKTLSIIKSEQLTSKISDIKNCNFFIVCVPTPIKKNKDPENLNKREE